jgi:hypothetical protein
LCGAETQLSQAAAQVQASLAAIGKAWWHRHGTLRKVGGTRAALAAKQAAQATLSQI